MGRGGGQARAETRDDRWTPRGSLLDRLVVAHELENIALRVVHVEGAPPAPAVFERGDFDSQALQPLPLGVEVALVDLEREVIRLALGVEDCNG